MYNNYRIYFWTTKDIYDLIDISDYDSISYINDNNIIDLNKAVNSERCIISIFFKNKLSLSEFCKYNYYIDKFCNNNTETFYQENDKILYNNYHIINYDL
mgnify:FL=1